MSKLEQKNTTNYTVLCQMCWTNSILSCIYVQWVIQCQCISVHLRDVWVQAYNVYISKLLKIGAFRENRSDI